jgi:hypothetical protein
MVLAAGPGWLSGAPRAGEKGAPAEKKGQAKKEESPEPPDRKRPEDVKRVLEMRDALNKTVDFAGLDDPKTTLQEALEGIGKVHRITFSVNEKAFTGQKPNTDARKNSNAMKTEVANPPIAPMRATLATVVRAILDRVEGDATYLIRKDGIEVTTEKALRAELGASEHKPGGPLLTLVWHDFRKVSVQTALEEVADAAGVNVVLDPRAEKQAAAVVSARLLNVSVESALEVLSDLAGLDVVRVENVFYVTTPENAEKFRKKQAGRQKEAVKAPPRPAAKP